VVVMVSGPANLLAGLSSDNLVVNLDLSGVGTGSHLVSVRKDLISAPSGVSIISYIPNNVTVKIE